MVDIELLLNKDNNIACNAMEEIKEESKNSPQYYTAINVFIDMLNNNNSYIRNRGLILIAANAKWDIDNIIDEIIDVYLKHITDDKPITARVCINCLPELAQYKPDLKGLIIRALENADITKYAESMAGLVHKDIVNCLVQLTK